jgi:hypothetical protein
MKAKYPSHCNLCDSAIVPGDEITRDNNAKPHRFYVHTNCNPVAGVSRAGFAVVVTVADDKGWIPVGVVKRYVHRGPAEGCATGLRQLGATVEVRALARKAEAA